jgi:lysophospholipase L1-like esterase
MLRIAPLVLALTLGAAAASVAADPQPVANRFAAQVDAYAAPDRASPPAACPVLFVGSASIRRWSTLAHDLAPYPVLNRGLDGADVGANVNAEIADINANFARLVAPYRPRAIVFYAGENDLHDGDTPDEVVADFNKFMALKRATLPHVRVYFVSLKPSKARLTEYPAQEAVNRKIQAMSVTRHDLILVDLVDDMMADGKPKDVFAANGLNLNPAGYAIWTKNIRRVLDWTGAQKLKCPPEPKPAKPHA